jgi:hypothetical protein
MCEIEEKIREIFFNFSEEIYKKEKFKINNESNEFINQLINKSINEIKKEKQKEIDEMLDDMYFRDLNLERVDRN